MLTAVALKASASDIAEGLYGFSPTLTAIALATVFYKPGPKSALWAVLGILVTVFVQAGMNVLTTPLGLATLTAPFCIVTWLFLLPLIRFDSERKPRPFELERREQDTHLPPSGGAAHDKR